MSRANSVNGKVIVITGAASGMGLETSRYLASQGAKVSLADVQEGSLKQIASEIEQAGGRALYKTVDVRDRTQVQSWIKATVDTFGKIDGCANLAGVIGKQNGLANVEEVEDEHFDFVMNVNVKGLLNCMRAQIPQMNDGGSIVNASSILGLQGQPKSAAYVASKHAVIGLTRTAAKELGERKIRCNCFNPGIIDTPMLRASAANRGSEMSLGHLAIKRKGEALEIAHLLEFLLSDASSYITGTCQSIDGGWHCYYIWDRLGLPREALNSLRLEDPRGQTYYPSSFKLDHLAQSTIGLSALAAALVQSTRTQGKTPEVTLPVKHACLEFVTERLYTIDGEPPKSTWGPIGGLHATADGHVRVHDNFPHHRYGALKLLGLSAHASRDEVAEKVRRWKRFELENQAAEHGLAIYALRSYEEWDATPQAAAVSDLPIQLGKISDEGPNGLPAHVASHSDRCLRGLRIVELSRVVAAPVAGKTLAAHGADVLWITSPNLPDLPDLDRNLSQGKRTIQLDLNTESDRETLRSLLKEADVFLQGYRPSSLAAKGFSTADLLALKPGIIVANLSAFGPDGPWAGRRGFDSLVQTCSGMNVSEAEHVGDGTVAKPLPCQALDHTAGYLLATGVAAAVYKRAAEGGSWQVDVSLAGVMKYLRSLGQRPEREGFERAVGLPNVAEVLEDRNLFEEKQSGFGMIKALKHAARVDGAVTGWDHMPKPLGSDEARWL